MFLPVPFRGLAKMEVGQSFRLSLIALILRESWGKDSGDAFMLPAVAYLLRGGLEYGVPRFYLSARGGGSSNGIFAYSALF